MLPGKASETPYLQEMAAAFVLLAYTLIQLFLRETERGELAPKVRERLLQPLLPQEDRIYIYCDHRYGIFTGLEHQNLVLSVPEGARRRLRGKTRRLLRHQRRPLDLPLRPRP